MAWPTQRTYVGRGTPRAEAPAKVTGRAKYTTDVAVPGVLFGAIFRSKWPAARIRKVDLSKALAAPGIKAGIVAAEVPFDVRYYGAEIAAIAGISKQAVLDALALIEVSAEPRPFVVDETEAAMPDAPRVAGDTRNLGYGKVKTEGDVDAAFASSAAVIEATYSTPIQIHHPLEPHGHMVQLDGGEVTAWSSTQAVFGCREAFSGILNVPQSKVRVVCEHMGGGFGSKFGPGAEGALCARLAAVAKAPVRLVLTRFEQALAVGNRPSSVQKIKLGASADGKLTAFALESFGTPGFSSGVTNEGGSGGASFPAPYLYKPPAFRVKQGSVAVNAGQSCAMRAPGHPAAAVGIEAAVDDLAAKLGIDPVEMRLKNDPSPIRRREYEIGAERLGWKERYRKPGTTPGPVKVGLGCAGAGWMSHWHPTQAELEVHADGTVEVRVGTQDLGTGSRTVAQVVAADRLGIEASLVTARIGDTRLPWSGASGGSQTTASVAPAVYDACENLVAELKRVSGLDDVRGANWKAACAKIGNAPLIARGKFREDMANTGACGVQFAEVEVDTDTGVVKLRRMLVVQDVGAVINKLTCESQIHGGVIMGLGYALYEQRVMDRRSGVVLNPNFETYKLPGLADIPDIDVILLDEPERGVIGVGEPCTVPTAAAIANAVANAIGVRVADLPLTPDRVLAALGKVPETGRHAQMQRERATAFASLAQLSANTNPEELHT